MSWPNFDQNMWLNILNTIAFIQPKELPQIQASDRDAGAIEMARANAKRAGVSDYIQFDCRAISSISPPFTPGWMITNPPYGLRINSNKDIRNLYAQFGKVLRIKCKNWRTAILSSDQALLSQTGLRFDSTIHFSNGGINVTLAKSVIP